MLIRSNSLPNLTPAKHAGETCGTMTESAPKRVLEQVDKVAVSLTSSGPLSRNALELLSLTLAGGSSRLGEAPLAWRERAELEPRSVFDPLQAQCWRSYADLPQERKEQTVVLARGERGDYEFSLNGSTQKVTGEDAFFKAILAAASGRSAECVSDQAAGELRLDLAAQVRERRETLGRLWNTGRQEGLGLDGAVSKIGLGPGAGLGGAPIRVEPNPVWVNKDTRAACKYSPVVVGKNPGDEAIKSMQAVLQNRIETCQDLAMTRHSPDSDSCGWFSFIRGSSLNESRLSQSAVPAIVISGGSAKKIAADLGKDFSLAWHPMNMRNEPVYLLVHRLDYESYASALSDALGRYPNLHLIGWDGGALTGFGAVRAAAVAFADTLPYRPERILMMDQDVVQTEATRHTRPDVQSKIENMHEETGKPIIGYGVGYPTREPVPKPFSEAKKPEAADFNSPAQQFVSVAAPFRSHWDDGIYPPYMVAGGEDMLMGMELELIQDGRNLAVLEDRILKKELKGEADTPNAYWSQARVETLKALFEAEKDVQVEFQGKQMSVDDLMSLFVANQWIEAHPSAESYNVAACVIERVILRLHKEGRFGDQEGAVFNRS